MKGPQTLQEAVRYFTDLDNCINYLVAFRWPNGVICPVCGSKEIGYTSTRRVWECKAKPRHAKRQFSIKVGTILEDSPISLDKWLPVLWLIANCRNGISSWEIHRDIGVTQKTAWFMLHRVRLAMQDDLTGGMLGGEVEVDESYIGGKVRNMHKNRKRRAQAQGRNIGNKTIVLGMLERETEKRSKRVRASIIADRTRSSMTQEVQAHIERGSQIHSDEFVSNWRMDDEYVHNVINHAECYVDGQIHTNGLENFWSLLKRGIGGTYIAVEPFHLFRYIDEQAFRYNNRKDGDGEVISDADRFGRLCSQIVGRRLTYKELIGKEGETEAF